MKSHVTVSQHLSMNVRKTIIELTLNGSNTAVEMDLLALANENIEGQRIPVGYCSYCASSSRKIGR